MKAKIFTVANHGEFNPRTVIETFTNTCILSLMLSASTTQQLYEEIQSNNKNRCKPELNRNAQAECQEGSNRPYDDYKRERDELLKRNEQ